ncbi:MAG: hypothetical protein ACYTF7_11375 [Planctomycetota bacterium]|jgi:hypothetical protein
MATIQAGFKLHTSPGRTNETGKLFLTIDWDGKQLSITGVEGPLEDGDARGSCGQCIDALERLDALHEGWSPNDVRKLAEIWRAWHLNNMRAGCEHQRANWNPAEPIQLYHYRLNTDISTQRRKIQQDHERRLKAGETVTATDEELRLLKLPHSVTTDGDSENSPDPIEYSLDKRSTRWPGGIEQKTAGWVRPHEHPKGLLTKPCEVCGYEYGTKWLHEDVPADVLAWLEQLPPDSSMPLRWSRD